MAWRQWLENGSVQRFADRDQTDLCSASPKTGTTLLAVFPTVLHDRKACKKRKYNREQLHLVTAKISAQKPLFCVEMNNLRPDSLGKLLWPQRPSSTSKT